MQNNWPIIVFNIVNDHTPKLWKKDNLQEFNTLNTS